jgi:hypothetical protein
MHFLRINSENNVQKIFCSLVLVVAVYCGRPQQYGVEYCGRAQQYTLTLAGLSNCCTDFLKLDLSMSF